MNKCNTCQHCMPSNYPPDPRWGKAYGWCMVPLPAHITPTQPLIYQREMRGKVCATWQAKI